MSLQLFRSPTEVSTFVPRFCHRRAIARLHDRSEMVHGVPATATIGSIVHKGINHFLIAP